MHGKTLGDFAGTENLPQHNRFGTLGYFGVISESAKLDLGRRVWQFEESGNTVVLNPGESGKIQQALMDVPGSDRWTTLTPGLKASQYGDTWKNLWNRVNYRIQDAGGTQTAGPPPSVFWSAALNAGDAIIGRERMNSIIYSTTPSMAPDPTTGTRPGENKDDPANRGIVDDLIDKIPDKIPDINKIMMIIAATVIGAVAVYGISQGFGSKVAKRVLGGRRKK